MNRRGFIKGLIATSIVGALAPVKLVEVPMTDTTFISPATWKWKQAMGEVIICNGDRFWYKNPKLLNLLTAKAKMLGEQMKGE